MRIIDLKYRTSGDITKHDGTPVPEDELLILFRAKDNLLVPLLEHYKQMCAEAGSLPKHLDLLQQRIDQIRQWQAEHPDRMNTPGTGPLYAAQQ